MMADITKCAPHTLETFVCYVVAEHSRRRDGENRVWILVGLIVRAALQMGYHRSQSHSKSSTFQLIHDDRDPEQYKDISPFDGEMRPHV